MRGELSERQRQILEYIRKCVEEKGYPPSVREIGQAVGLSSSSTVHGHLNRLEQKGYIRRDPTKPRAIELLSPQHRRVPYQQVPVVGRVTAGEPILAVENVETYVPVSKEIFGDDELFVLKVRGESMIEAGILDGDWVIVRRQATAENGDIVVARLDDEATVKRFYREQGKIRLQPENPTVEPIITDRVEILGLVVGLFRKLA
ncbi:transcriptional repressor LexA [Limnochorda sp.]|jgi:repressor LexA|uniref:transcriptional repressor LexA n=1 Tax=Limnochorda sp. TaxID=1940279 RepID=UPI001E01A740|nr:repressor LexA [Bacillota bacterium]MBO2518868.1 repressor LexA [Bacillota bacterium]